MFDRDMMIFSEATCRARQGFPVPPRRFFLLNDEYVFDTGNVKKPELVICPDSTQTHFPVPSKSAF
jgi:hypothetical protein